MPIFFLFFFLLLICSASAQDIPQFDESETALKKTFEHKIQPSGLPDELNCQCPRHLASKSNIPPRAGFNPAGVAVLDSLPSQSEVIKIVRLAEIASSDSIENSGYKRFYAMMSLKAFALDCGANALYNITQFLQGDSLIFTATAIRILRR